MKKRALNSCEIKFYFIQMFIIHLFSILYKCFVLTFLKRNIKKQINNQINHTIKLKGK